MNNNYIYLIWRNDYKIKNIPIYKIGMTTQPNYNRFNQYIKGSHLIYQCQCLNSLNMEREIIKKFKENFILREGREYFEGDANKMIDIIYNTIRNEKELINEKINNIEILDNEDIELINILNSIKEEENKKIREINDEYKKLMKKDELYL